MKKVLFGIASIATIGLVATSAVSAFRGNSDDEGQNFDATITNVGPPDSIAEGDLNVLPDGLPIAREGDGTAHGGVIVEGSDRIFVNGRPVAFIGGQTTSPMITGTIPHVGGPIVANIT